jgi:4a-hydroxytetrahydrobiopterin dehydratase
MNATPLEGSAKMDAASVAAHLAVVPDWTLDSGAIERSFKFNDYWHTLAFINALAFVVHRQDHHPEITFGYNLAKVRFDTHSVKGISLNDFICAAKADALYAARPGSEA